MHEMSVEDYVAPVQRQVRTQFLTARAAARRMIDQGDGGVILFFGGEGDPPRGFHLGALQTGFRAVEAIRLQLAVELGVYGIRTVSLRSGGVPESISADFAGATRSPRASTPPRSPVAPPRSRTWAASRRSSPPTTRAR